MNHRSMVLRPLIMTLVLITILVLFSSASYAIQVPKIYHLPTLQVTANPQSVGTGQVTNINVNIADVSAWTHGGTIIDNEVDLKYSGPGNVVMGSTQSKLDNNNQFLTTFKADKAGEYTITATVGAIVQWTNGSADWVFANNSTKVTVTSGSSGLNPGKAIDPGFSGFVSPSPSPSAGLRHDLDFNQSGFVGLADNGTSGPSPQPSNDTGGQATPSGQSSPASSPNAQDGSQPAAAASPGTASPLASPPQGGSGDNGSMTTYLLIAVVALIAIVGILGGYILGKGKK